MLTTAPYTTDPCPDCGAPIPPASPGDLCPRCLALAAVGTFSTSSIEVIARRRFFGDYELLDEIGRGGSGIVFKARQLGVNRTVALKLLSGGAAAGRDFVHRFHTEAAAAAQLEHPNTVPIYEFGEHEGAHYLAMRYLEGGTLADQLRSPLIPTQLQLGTPNTEPPENCCNRFQPRDAARLLITISQAVEHAHRRGILHRDLKPGNILLDAGGTPYVSDFGLARFTELDSSLTLSHAVIGTISYLAPEVAASGATGSTTASDIYGLGAILYQMLTGRPPFEAETFAATVRKIADQEPVPPRKENPSIAIDLETIVLKCLEKEPVKRYATAQALADDLQHFLNNEPITARPITRTARVIRWSQRNPALATAYSVLILLSILILIASPLAAFRINQARKAEAAARHRAEQNLYAADMLLTQSSLSKSNMGRALKLLDKHRPTQNSGADERGWEWHYYFQQTLGEEKFILGYHSNSVTAVGFLPDDKTVWSAGWDKTVRLWNFDTRSEMARLNHDKPVYYATQSPDGRWLATVTAEEGKQNKPQLVRLWDLSTRQMVAVLATNRWPRQTMAFSPDGRLLAFAGIPDGIHLIDVHTRREVAFLPVSYGKQATVGLAFGPDNRTFAYAPDRSGMIVLWDVQAKTNLASLNGHTDISHCIAFSRDGSRLASGALDRTLRIWNLPEHREELVLTNYAKDFFQLSFSTDGERLAVIDERQQLRFLNTKTGAITRELRGHLDYITGLAVSPNRKVIVTGSDDRTVRVWDAEPSLRSKTSQPLPPGVLLTPNRSHAIGLSPDGQYLIAVFTNSISRIWNTRQFSQVSSLSLPTPDIHQVALGSGGKLAAFAFNTGSNLIDYVVWDIARNQPQFLALKGVTHMAGRIRFSHDGQKLAFGAMAHLYVFDLLTGRQTHKFLYEQDNEPDLIGGIAFSIDGRFVAATTHLGWVLIWDLAGIEPRRVFRPAKSPIIDAVFSRDTRTLIAAGANGIFAYDLTKGERLPDLNPKPPTARAVALSPDGETIALAEDDTITLWKIQSHQLVGELTGHQRELRDLAFGSDGKTLVSAAYDEYRLWRAAEIEPTSKSNDQP